jgi:hypothetical protein
MKSSKKLLLFLLSTGSLSANGLYRASDTDSSDLPLEWTVGTNLIYDSNVFPGIGDKETSFAINPSAELSFVRKVPQTTLEVSGRLGLIYYLDTPAGMSDTNSQSRASVNVSHHFSELLRFSSRNYISYELEPDYSYGIASGRSESGGENLYWQTDNSFGYRWSELLGTFTGVRVNQLDSEVDTSDRLTWGIFNQVRYQYSPTTVITTDYRYSDTAGGGAASDAVNHYLMVGSEHRFSPTTLGILNIGAQFRKADLGESSSSPFLEFSLNSVVNESFKFRTFVRYGLEDYDTVQIHPDAGSVEFDEKAALRLGIVADYSISSKFSLFGGLDYISSSYGGARPLAGGSAELRDLDEDLINMYVGVKVQFTDSVSGNFSYNFTDSSSDIAGKTYDRERVNLGVSFEF